MPWKFVLSLIIICGDLLSWYVFFASPDGLATFQRITSYDSHKYRMNICIIANTWGKIQRALFWRFIYGWNQQRITFIELTFESFSSLTMTFWRHPHFGQGFCNLIKRMRENEKKKAFPRSRKLRGENQKELEWLFEWFNVIRN